MQATSQLPSDSDKELAAEIEAISLGWAVLPAAMDAWLRLREDLAATAGYLISAGGSRNGVSR